MSEGDWERMTEACLIAAEHVMANGSPELQAAMRVTLLILWQEIARDVAAGDTVAALLEQSNRALGDDT